MNLPSPIVRFDPDAPRDFSPFKLGPYTVRRARLPGSHYTIYSTMLGDLVAGRQISYPDLSDCERHVRIFEFGSTAGRQQMALLDTQLHERIVGILRTKEMDKRDLCRMFDKTSPVLEPVLAMLAAEQRIVKRGGYRRPIFSAPAQSPQAKEL